MLKRNFIFALFLILLGGFCLLTACENEPPLLHVYDDEGNDLLASNSAVDSCVSCHADEEYLRQELECNPVEEPPVSEEAAGEG